ncbi:MAG TPA: CGNR zinc finger domain-containing protein [Actinomycetota bacterium]|nr:CGNR zinc finger domain-containing protein [Actinomycetota bacterium]
MSQANFGPYTECSLELAVDLVNSENPTSGDDELAGPADLARFLKEHKLGMSLSQRPTESDLGQVRKLRGVLRQVFAAPDAGRAGELLNGLLAKSGARPELTDHDGQEWHLHYSPPGTPIAPRLTAETAMALSVVIAADGFERLRVCEGDRCVDVFVDESRNRSRRFCSPSVCGNRASVAAFRARQRTGEADSV